MEEVSLKIFGIDVIYFWLGLIVIFGILETLTLDLSAIWFSVGALFAMICAGLNLSISIQIFAFILGTGIMLLLLKPAVKKLMLKKPEKTNLDRIVGQTAIVIEEINNSLQTGQIKVLGAVWTSRSENDIIIPINSKVLVCEIRGVKAIVKTID